MRFKEIVDSQLSGINKSTLVGISDRDETDQMNITSHNLDPAKPPHEGQCRICFEQSDSMENPLLSLCKCSGSVKYIHFDCLKDWISNNVKKDQSSNCLHYSFFETKC